MDKKSEKNIDFLHKKARLLLWPRIMLNNDWLSLLKDAGFDDILPREKNQRLNLGRLMLTILLYKVSLYLRIRS